MRKAKLHYVNEGNFEGYQIDILSNGDWVMDSRYPLVRRENATENEEANFVPYTILTKLRELRTLGYDTKIF